MKTIAKLVLALMFCAGVKAEPLNEFIDLYIGADAQIRRMKFHDGLGDNLLHKTHGQGNVYFGVKLNEYFAFEAGHESTITRTCHATLTEGDRCAGVSVSSIMCPISFISKVKIKGAHFDIVGAYPLDNVPVEFLGAVGISSLKGTVERKTTTFGRDPVQQSGTVRTLSKRSAAMRFMTGAQYRTECGLKFRGTVNWLVTHHLVIKKSDENASIYIPRVRPKDSLVLGLGVLYSF